MTVSPRLLLALGQRGAEGRPPQTWNRLGSRGKGLLPCWCPGGQASSSVQGPDPQATQAGTKGGWDSGAQSGPGSPEPGALTIGLPWLPFVWSRAPGHLSVSLPLEAFCSRPWAWESCWLLLPRHHPVCCLRGLLCSFSPLELVQFGALGARLL